MHVRSNTGEGEGRLACAIEAGKGAGLPVRVAFITLGCAKNEVDTLHMQERLAECGCVAWDDPETADVVVVNTCSFIQSATEESIEAVLDAAGLDNVREGRAKLVVAGCMPARYGAELEHELPEASSFVPCDKERDIAEVVDALFPGRLAAAPSAASLAHPAAPGGAAPDDNVPAGVAPVPFSSIGDPAQGPWSAYVKISDGCDRFCSYCAIPFIRGRYHSFPYAQIEAEVVRRVAQGAREVVLIAQDTGRWGADLPGEGGLASLVSRLAEAFPRTWFRVMYIQPEGVTDDLLDAVASHDNVCPYFDIPLQHVSAPILRAMNRRGDREGFVRLVSRIKARVPEATLRTTLIVGFPGEDDEQFEELCDFVGEGLFEYVGVFAYSQEEGTRAAGLPDQVPEEEKRYRAQRMRDLADAASAPRVAERVGRELDVLVLGREEDGQLYGRAMCQAPDVDGVCYLDHGEPGEIVRITVSDVLLYEMEGS